MATVDSVTIKIRRGLKANLPARAEDGELLYCTDTNELYVGKGESAAPVLLNKNIDRVEIPLNISGGSPILINHNLGSYPNVIILDDAKSLCLAPIRYVSNSSLELNIAVPFLGSVILS
jgi:hypothetical protein